MDVHDLGDRAEAVRRIGIAVVGGVVFETPHVVVAGRIVHAQPAQVVVVGSLGVYDLAEKSLLGHVQRSQLEEVVAAVFEHHEVLAGFFRGIDQLPAFVEGQCRRHFRNGMLALLHCINGDRRVHLPVGADVDQIDVIQFAGLFPYRGVAAEFCGFRETGFIQRGLGFGYVTRHDVAQGDDLRAVHMRQAFNGSATTHTQSDHGDTYRVDRIASQLQDVLLTGRARRLGKFDHCAFLLLLTATVQHDRRGDCHYREH